VETVLSCPVCGAVLTLDARAAACANKHTFDRARNGYLNLLLSNKKQSAEPGDSLAMLTSRRAFLQAGYYDQMAAAAVDALRGVEGHVADLGCGEGFFTTRVKAALPSATLYGVDISRPGIKMAAATKGVNWIVASLHRSPFMPGSLSAALSIFAPIDPADVRRVLRADGTLITVTPGPDHLDALRTLIYSSAKPHPATPALMAGDTLFTHASSTRVRYPIAIESQAQIMNLLAMTPYYWHVGPATMTAILQLPRIDLTVDAYVNVFKPVLS
jgi:23S rRNA (guanine745-N1)-methyltransferase